MMSRSGKVTENKFQLDVEIPEMLDDWDQRWVMSTLTRENNRITLNQIAEKTEVFKIQIDIIIKMTFLWYADEHYRDVVNC